MSAICTSWCKGNVKSGKRTGPRRCCGNRNCRWRSHWKRLMRGGCRRKRPGRCARCLTVDSSIEPKTLSCSGILGSGKTHLLQAVGQELVRKGRRIFFTRCEMLVQELLIAKRDLKLSKLIKKYARYEEMVIDDLGYIRQTREEMEVVDAGHGARELSKTLDPGARESDQAL